MQLRTVTVKRLKMSKMKVLQINLYQFNVVYFAVQNSNLMFYFVGSDRKTSIIKKKNSGLLRISDMVAVFL